MTSGRHRDRQRCEATETSATRASARRRRRCGAAGAGVLLASALAYIGSVDPHELGSAYPPCPFLLLTGVHCPVCGGLRMINDLLHWDLAAAAADNAFLLVGIPALTGFVVVRRHRGATALPAPVMVAVAAAAIAWTVVRNVPGFPLTPMVTG